MRPLDLYGLHCMCWILVFTGTFNIRINQLQCITVLYIFNIIWDIITKLKLLKVTKVKLAIHDMVSVRYLIIWLHHSSSTDSARQRSDWLPLLSVDQAYPVTNVKWANKKYMIHACAMMVYDGNIWTKHRHTETLPYRNTLRR